MTPSGIEPSTAVPLAYAIIDTYLGSFAKLRKATIGFILCAVRPQGATRLPLDGFLLNLLCENFEKMCREYLSFIKIGQE